MSIREYNKLVRDRIPQIIEQQGCLPNSYIADELEYAQRLRDKLQEEVSEYLEDESVEELADVLEVIYALCAHKNISFQDLELQRQKKKAARGGFTKRIVLTTVDVREE